MSFMINFFALKGDMLLVLGELEAKRQVKYVQGGRLDGPKPEIWYTATDLPSLGQATGDQQAACDDFLIVDRGADVLISTMTMLSGDDRFDVYNGGNPDSIEFQPAGEWKDGAIICGRFATLHKTPESQALMRMVRSRIKKHFTRVRAYWVGPEALTALRSGRRLTMAIQSPSEFNLCEHPEEEFDGQ
jgi:hypothetical protein